MQDLNQVKNFLKTCPSYNQWKNIKIKNHHGFVVPLFAIHSHTSCGIGEFLDLIPLIDWCSCINIDVIQLLPLNEMGRDFSPYNAISSIALDPIYLCLYALPNVKKHKDLAKDLTYFTDYNKNPKICYPDIKKLKLNWLFKYFKKEFKNFEKTKHYQNFIKQNPELNKYALFRSIREEYGDKKWQTWPLKYQNPSEKIIDKLTEKYKLSISFYKFLQYLCYLQLEKVKEYAFKKKVFIKGDIPILISPDSYDVWNFKSYFDLSHVVGCPPDDFNMAGQKWGFPLFNWTAIKKDNFDWWKTRLNVASSIYHLYRIDHVVGFFRLWTMLPKQDPINGKFLPKDPKKWFSQGKEILLNIINASPMLPLAEDLGLIPDEVYSILNELGICGTKIMCWQYKKRKYIPYDKYNPLSMTTTGTHDLESLEEWWKKHPKEAKAFAKFKGWNYSPKFSKKMRFEILKDSHHTNSLFHINPLVEYLNLFNELSWNSPQDDRINIPGTSLPTNWTYKFKPSIEKIISHEALKNKIINIIH
jgi:4-alpha-glucanotransferase